MRWLRQYIWGSLAATGPLVALVLLHDLFMAEFGTVNRFLLTVLILGVVVQRFRFIGYTAKSVDFALRGPVEQILTCGVAVVAWAYAARYTEMAVLWALLPAVVGGSSVISAPPENRRQLAYGLLLATAATGALALSWQAVPGVSVLLVVAGATFMVTVFVGIDLVTVRFWDLVQELDEARELAGELAATRERLRFSADLHDIQGHSLQAIAMKGQIVERLIGIDNDASRKHAADLTMLARTGLTDTRRIAHGYREVGLVTEIDNAVELMRATGINVRVYGDPSAIAPPLQQPFGALVREGTTNILRHSRAENCELTVDVDNGRVRVRLGNDGIRHLAGPSVDGSGVVGLRERFATIGGDVTPSSPRDDWFELGVE